MVFVVSVVYPNVQSSLQWVLCSQALSLCMLSVICLEQSKMKNVWAFICGGLFSIGLMLSGMSNPAKVIGFLDIFGQWDASLAFVILGSLLFGIGWGIAGICPAPSFTLIGLGYYQAIYFIIAMFVGVLLHRKVMEKMP